MKRRRCRPIEKMTDGIIQSLYKKSAAESLKVTKERKGWRKMIVTAAQDRTL